MTANTPIRRGPLIIFVISVCLAGALVAWFFGLLAATLYTMVIIPPGEPVSSNNITINIAANLLGLFSGLLAGVIWCWVMISILIHKGRNKLILQGTLLGIAVGVLSTIILHTGLMIIDGQFDLGILVIGLVFGVAVGAIVGFICGLICWSVAEKACSIIEPEGG